MQTAVDVVLEPGEASIHHVRLVHGSGPNRAKTRRIGLAVRYLPTHVRQLNEGNDSATLVRGRDDFGHFAHETAPSADFHPDAIAMHTQVIEAQARILFRGAKSTPWNEAQDEGASK